MLKTALISLLLQWSGDYKAQFQFDGKLGVFIKGEEVLSDKNPKSPCDLEAKFDRTAIKDRLPPSSEHLKMTFRFSCKEDKQTKVITLSPEFVRRSDLKTLSSVIYISSKFPKNQLKILELSGAF